MGEAVPEDLVLVGHVTGAYGVQGWIRIRPYSGDADAMLHAKTWWIDKPEWQDVERLHAKHHSGDVVAQLMGMADRSAAEALQGAAVHVRRAHFPALADDEFYWVDLIGSRVENLQGDPLGVVADMMDNGAHPIMRIVSQAENDQSAERLIPFVDQFLHTVSPGEKRIVVDWGLDF
jgi:16S rRNA processing protein RimM